LDRHDAGALKRFKDVLEQMPEVMEAFLMAGEYNYYITVATSARSVSAVASI
jgi:DNA-binding Lrp family transcriptional regulator